MLYIIAAILLWSSIGIVIRFSGMPVQLLIFFSCIISLTLLGFLFLKGSLRQNFPSGRYALYLILVGPVSLLNSFTFFYAYQNTTIANAVLTHYTAPVVVAILAPIFLKERLTIIIFVAITLSTAGLWIMLDISLAEFLALLFAGDKNTLGIIAGLVSGIAYGILIIILRFFAQKFNPIVITFFQSASIALILLPFVEIPANFTSALWAFGVMGVVHSTIAPLLYFRGLKEVTANKSAILGYLEPVCAIILGILFLSEAVTYKIVIGGLMILFSGYLTIIRRHTCLK
jgi:drug/metabolite transporter (DMT)-like permease